MSTSLKTRLLGASALAAFLAVSGMAAAQDAAPADGAATALDEVVVTASRIQRDGFETPTPVTVLAPEVLEAQGNRSIAQTLYQLPSIVPMTSGNGGATNIGAQYVALRNLGATRTLVLINGRRVSQTNPLGGTDINLVPGSLIENVEVVTGGASATYGSDAVAGMVNLQLNNKLQGVKGDVQYGVTQYGDGREYSGSLALGTRFAGDRGHVVVAGEYTDNSGMETCEDRDWCQDNWALVVNPAYKPGNGEYRQIITPNARVSTATFGGLITAGPLKGTRFLPGGVPAPFEYGTAVGTTMMIGGTDDGWTGKKREGVSPINRKSFYTSASFELNEHVSLFAEAAYARTHSQHDSGVHNNLGNLVIRRDNAFLPATIRAQMVALNLQSFNFGRLAPELGADAPDATNTNQRYVVGARGVVAGWNWETYVQTSRNRYLAKVVENRIEGRWTQAVDSLIDPATGQPTCRSTLTNPGNGCVPVNLFGAGSISEAVKAWVTGDSFQDARSRQDVFAVNVNGEPFSLWAGPVSFATGFEYRKDSLVGTADPLSYAFAWRQQNAQAIDGSFTVKEVYAETVVPLAKDMTLIENLEVNGAVRLTDYSTSGTVTTWKVGANYSPVADLRFRVTQSRDIRAPNNNELFSSLVQNIPTVNDPVTNVTLSIATFTGGNPDLKPEEADTFTGGVIYSPSFIPGLRGSVDVFSITLNEAITTLGAQGTVDACFRGQETACAGVVRDPATNRITSIFSRYFNLQTLKTRGVDFELSYQMPMDRLSASWSGSLRARLLASYIDELSQKDGGVVIERAGQVVGGGVPHWRGNLNVIYDNGPLLLSLTGLYVEGGKWDNSYGPFDINDNTVSGRTYFNVSAQYTLYDSDRRKLDLFAKVENLFDRDPPLTPLNAFNPTPTQSPFYDKLGRRFAVGLRFRL